MEELHETDGLLGVQDAEGDTFQSELIVPQGLLAL